MSYWTHWFSNFIDAQAEGVCKISEEQKLGEIYSKYGRFKNCKNKYCFCEVIESDFFTHWPVRVQHSVLLFSDLPFVQVEPLSICFLWHLQF